MGRSVVFRGELDTQYEFARGMNPGSISTAISTATAKPRLLFLVKTKESGKMGIVICHGGKDEWFLLAPGQLFGNGDDFSWMDTRFCAQARAQAKLIGEALLIETSNQAAD